MDSQDFLHKLYSSDIQMSNCESAHSVTPEKGLPSLPPHIVEEIRSPAKEELNLAFSE